MPEEYLHPSDIRQAHILTRVISKRTEDTAVYDVGFAPMRSTQARKIKIFTRQYNPAGLASFHATNASTPIVKGGGVVEEIYMELVEISEKHTLSATDLIQLASPDETVARGIARDIVQLGAELRQRNTQRTKWMAYQAVQDDLSITYPDGGAIAIDYDLNGDGNNASDFSGSHLVTASVDWNNIAADIIGDLDTWAGLIEDDLGVLREECILHINKRTWRQMKKNTAIKAELSATNPRIITPKLSEVIEILGIAQIVFENGYYKTATDLTTKYKFIPDGRGLLTAPYVTEGVPLMEMYDGPVVQVQGNGLVVGQNPGMVAEIYANLEQKVNNLRLSTARIPVMNRPAGFVWCTLY